MSRRRGFSLAELMVALVIAGIIGVALTRLVISQARFVASQDGTMRARAVARAGLATLSDELRQVADGGIVAANADSVTLRIPYAYGAVCTQSGGATIVALLPPDSSRYASALNSGYAWRDSNGVWSVVEPATRNAVTTVSCWGASPQVIPFYSPSMANYAAALSPNVVATQNGAAVYLYQTIRYAFAPSTALPGREGLYREVIGSGLREELVTPFDTSSRFQFLVGYLRRAQTNVPAVLDSINGLRILLVAATEQPPPGKTVPTQFPLITDIVFRNHGP